MGERQYNFGMADMDWGWKKKRSEANVDPAVDVDDDVVVDKKNLASLARSNLLPTGHRIYRRFYSKNVRGKVKQN